MVRSSHRVNGEIGAAPALISVVIPARNAAATLEEQLEALSGQDYEGAWEVLVADNGSTDDTIERACRFTDRLPVLRVVEAPNHPGAAHARNRGAAAACGDFLAFCDADDVVAPHWLSALAAGARACDGVGGSVQRYPPGAGGPESAGSAGLPCIAGFLPMAHSGNVGIWVDVFSQLGGWDEQFRIGEDVELSWRLQRNGYRLCFASDAIVWRRDPTDLRGLARRSFHYGMAGAHLYRRFRAAGARRDLNEAVRACGWLVTQAPRAVRSAGERRRWVNVLARRAGRLAGSVRYWVFYP